MIKNSVFTIIAISTFMSLMFSISLDIIFPSLPAMTHLLHVTNSTIQLTVSCYLLGYAVSQLIYGSLSDQYGRKPILFIGTFIYLVGGGVCLVTTTIVPLVIGRLIQGLGVGAAGLLSRVILRDSFEGDLMAKMTSYTSAAIIIGISIAPVIGGFIQNLFGYKGNFYCMILFGIVLLLVASKYLPETNQQKANEVNFISMLRAYQQALTTPDFLVYTFLTAMSVTVIIAYSIYNSFFIQQTLGFTSAQYGLLTLTIAVGEFFGAMLNSQFTEKLGANNMIKIGLLLIGLAGMGLIAMNWHRLTLAGILFPSFVAAMGTGLIISNAISLAYSKFKINIGLTGAIFGSLQILIMVIFNYIISVFCLIKINYLAGIFIVLCLVSALLMYFSKKESVLHLNTEFEKE